MSDIKSMGGLHLMLALFVIVLAISLACLGDTSSATRKELASVKAEAVKRGHAEWVVGSNNDPEFRWKP